MPSALPSKNIISGRHAILLYFGLIAAGLAGNYLNFPVFFNLNFFFGSIFTLLALQFFGFVWGIVATAIIASYTCFLWNEPYTIIIFTAEAAVVGLLMERRRIGMVVADTLFWLIIGMPLGYIYYYFVINLPHSNAHILIINRAINGIANALAARLIFTCFVLLSRSILISYREAIYNLLTFFVLVPALILLAIDSREDLEEIEPRIRTSLIQERARFEQRLETWVRNRQTAIANLAEMAASRTPGQMQPLLEQAVRSDTNFARVGLQDKDATATAFFPLADEHGQSAIGRNYADRAYLPALRRTLKPRLSGVELSMFGTPKPGVVVVAPVLIRGEFAGYVSGILTLTQIAEYLNTNVHQSGMLYTLLDKNGNVILTNRTGQTMMKPFARGAGTLKRLDNDISQWIPELPSNTPNLERWRSSFYVAETAIGTLSEWRLILEQPMAPYQKTLYDDFAEMLTILFFTLLGTLALAELLSRRFTVTFENLRKLTSDLPVKLAADGREIDWPDSSVKETAELIDNFREMAYSLSAQFYEVRQINESLQQQAEMLRVSEEKYRLLFDNANDAIYILDLQARFLAANSLAVKLFGYPLAELLTMTMDQVNSPEHAKNCAGRIATLKDCGLISFESEIQRRDGSRIPTEVNSRLITWDGQTAVLSICRDVSQRNQARLDLLTKQQQLEELNQHLELKVLERTNELMQERDNLRGILDAMENGVYVVNQQFGIEYANPAMLKEYGPFEGRTCYEYQHGRQDICPWCRNQEVFSGQSVFRESRSERTGKFLRTVDSPYMNAKGELCKLAIFTDITALKTMEEALRHQLYFTETLLDAIPSPVFYKDTEGRYLGCNKAYQEFREITKDDLRGKCVFDIAAPEDAEALHDMDMKLFSDADFREYETSILHKDGSRCHVIFHKARFNDSTGKPAGLIGIIQDITAVKLAEESIRDHNQELEKGIRERTRSLEDANFELTTLNTELELRRLEAEEHQEKLQQLSRAVENSPSIVVITDNLGLIEYVNPKFSEITGYLPEEVIGRNPRILNAGVHSNEFYRELWETILTGREWRGDFYNKKKNGGFYWEHSSISPIRNDLGEISHFVAIKEDITEAKRLSDELLAARDAAYAASRSKSEFLANMSHEIRTPLNAIIGFSSLTLKSSLPPLQKDYIGKIHTAGELLLNIINDILDFSKIEAGQLDMEQIPFRLDIVISNIISMLKQKVVAKGLNLRADTAPEVSVYLIGDPHRLVQIFANLLNNAFKFTEYGEIALESELLTRENEQVQLKFSVRDTGIGISEEQISKLFQPFTQADGSITRRFGGTGLGLSISKQLVELMNGKIWCESTPGKGSTFIFTAWFGIAQASDIEHVNLVSAIPGEEKRTSFDFSGSRILLVEDNETNRQLVIEILKETGAVMDVAADGKDAVAMITGGTQYDLVLMDIQMPVMDGYEATRLIRGDRRFAALPIIAMTAHAMHDEQQRSLQAGINAHIAKPIDAKAMLQAIRFYLHHRETGEHTDGTQETNGGHEDGIPEIAGLDVAAALELLDGNRKLYFWVLRTFLENESNVVTLIGDALNAGETALAIRLAHTVKGSAGSMGAVELVERARSLENVLVSGESTETIRGAYDLFSTEFNRLVTDLTNQLPPEADNDTTADSLDLAVVTPILMKLRDYIKGRDCKAERYLDDYQKQLAELPENEVTRLKKHLNNFNFTAAEEILMALAARSGIDLASRIGEASHS